MSKFLFDTTVFIDCLQRNNLDAVRHVQTVIEGTDSGCCSVITEAELWAGIRNRREELDRAALMSKFEIIPVTSNIARLAGGLLRGRSVGEIKAHFGDALIAASAMQVGETVLTADRASQRVSGSQAQYLVYR